MVTLFVHASARKVFVAHSTFGWPSLRNRRLVGRVGLSVRCGDTDIIVLFDSW